MEQGWGARSVEYVKTHYCGAPTALQYWYCFCHYYSARAIQNEIVRHIWVYPRARTTELLQLLHQPTFNRHTGDKFKVKEVALDSTGRVVDCKYQPGWYSTTLTTRCTVRRQHGVKIQIYLQSDDFNHLLYTSVLSLIRDMLIALPLYTLCTYTHYTASANDVNV